MPETRRDMVKLLRADDGIYRGMGITVVFPDDYRPWPKVITVTISDADLLNEEPAQNDGDAR